MSEGWVCLHRQLFDSRVFINEGLLKVWVWCLLKANHKEKWVKIKTGRGDSEVKVQPGQFIFGRKTAAKNLKMKSGTVYSRMLKLKKYENINMQPNTHYTLVTIINWDTYQCDKKEVQQEVQHPNNTQPTTNQQPNDTNNNDNNENNKDIPDLKKSGEDGNEEFYLTKKRKKLTGKRLETFNQFWDCFGYKIGKADAADSWLNIPELTIPLVKVICEAAKREAINRNEIISKGGTPKQAQGWLTSRRWEDETTIIKPISSNECDLPTIGG